MDMKIALNVLGMNRTRDGDLRPMVKALKMLRALNTAEEETRLVTAEYVLRHWDAYQDACTAARDLRRKGLAA